MHATHYNDDNNDNNGLEVEARQGKVMQDKARHDTARQGEARQGVSESFYFLSAPSGCNSSRNNAQS